MIAEHLRAVLGIVPRSVALRVVVLVGLVLPWAWLVALDRVLRRRG